MEQLFRQVRRYISDKDLKALQSLPIPKPDYFNWVKEVFEAINVQDHPNATALIWTDGHTTEQFSFTQAAKYCNQFLNFLKKARSQKDELEYFYRG